MCVQKQQLSAAIHMHNRVVDHPRGIPVQGTEVSVPHSVSPITCLICTHYRQLHIVVLLACNFRVGMAAWQWVGGWARAGAG